MKWMITLMLLLAPALAKSQTPLFAITKDTVCQDSCIRFFNVSIGHADSIRWSITGLTPIHPHLNAITVCFFYPGIYNVKLYVYDSGRADSTSHTVRINPRPHPALIDSFPCGLYVQGAYNSYQWYSPSLLPADTTNYVSGFAGQSFFVSVDSNGCVGISDTGRTCPPVSEIIGPGNIIDTNADIHFSPNPVGNQLNIRGNYLITSVVISDLLGQQLFNGKYSSKIVSVHVADLPNGMYIVNVNGACVGRFVKK